MIKRYIIITTMMLCLVTVGLTQNITKKTKKDFMFFAHKANTFIEINTDSAYYYIEKATIQAQTKRQLWDSYFLKGLIQYRKQEYNNAIISYNIALEHAPKSLVIYTQNNIANSLFEAQRYPEARKLVKHIITIDTSVNVYNTIGILAKIHSKQGQLRKAEQYFAQAIGQIPKSHLKRPQVMIGFIEAQAKMYLENQHPGKALKLYQKALSLYPSNYNTFNNKIGTAKAYINLNKNQEAAKLLAIVDTLAHSNNQKLELLVTKFQIKYKKLQTTQMRQILATIRQLPNHTKAQQKTIADLTKKLAKAEATHRQDNVTKLWGISILFGLIILAATWHHLNIKAQKKQNLNEILLNQSDELQEDKRRKANAVADHLLNIKSL